MYLELAKSGLLKKVMSVRKGDKVSKIRIKLGYIDDLKKLLTLMILLNISKMKLTTKN